MKKNEFFFTRKKKHGEKKETRNFEISEDKKLRPKNTYYCLKKLHYYSFKRSKTYIITL